MTTHAHTPLLRRFELVRDVDVTGVSGVGVVASGVCWPDGRCAMRWHPVDGRADLQSTAFYESIAAVRQIHGHGGATVVRWVDDASFRVLVNGLEFDVDTHDLTFDDVVELAAIPHADTVVWRRGSNKAGWISGSMHHGQAVAVVAGLQFEVARTGAA